MNRFESTRIALDTVGDTEISTVKLPEAAGGKYETCMFYANGDSNVVATYKTEHEAKKNHEAIVSHSKLHLMHRSKLPEITVDQKPV